jgi:hypothetical protein
MLAYHFCKTASRPMHVVLTSLSTLPLTPECLVGRPSVKMSDAPVSQPPSDQVDSFQFHCSVIIVSFAGADAPDSLFLLLYIVL